MSVLHASKEAYLPLRILHSSEFSSVRVWFASLLTLKQRRRLFVVLPWKKILPFLPFHGRIRGKIRTSQKPASQQVISKTTLPDLVWDIAAERRILDVNLLHIGSTDVVLRQQFRTHNQSNSASSKCLRMLPLTSWSSSPFSPHRLLVKYSSYYYNVPFTIFRRISDTIVTW